MNLNRLIEISYALKGKTISGGRNWHCAFILNKSKILSIGVNSYYKTHPKANELGYPVFSGIHAELAACLKLGLTDCSKYHIVVIRIDRGNKLNLSKPCKSCARLLNGLNFGLNNIIYSTSAGGFECSRWE